HDSPPPATSTLSLHDALPISFLNGRIGLMGTCSGGRHAYLTACSGADVQAVVDCWGGRVVMAPEDLNDKYPVAPIDLTRNLPCPDRKSTRLNSSHVKISYAVF